MVFNTSTAALCVLVLLSPAIANAHEELSPGIIAKLNPRGLDIAKDVFTDIISSLVPKIELSDIVGKKGVDYEYTKRTVSLRGSFDANVSDLSILQSVVIGKDKQGKPTLTVTQCSSNMGKLSLKVSDNVLSGILNIGIKLGNSLIRNKLNEKLCPKLKKSIAKQLDATMDTYNATVDLPFDTSIDLTLTRSPVIEENSVEVSVSGRCFPISFPNHSVSGTRTHMDPLPSSDKMFQLGISDFVINSCLASVFRHNIFKPVFTEEQVRDGLNFVVSTATLSNIVPSIARYIGRPLQVLLRPTNPPTVSLMENSARLLSDYEIIAQVIVDNETTVDALTIAVNIDVTGSITVNNSFIFGKFDDLTITVTESGAFPAAVAQALIDGLLRLRVLPALNRFSAVGYSLPFVNNYSASNATLNVKQNAIEISADIIQANEESMNINRRD